MPKRPGYRCRECGWESAAFAGRCVQCQAWNSMEQASGSAAATASPAARRRAEAAPARTLSLPDVPDDSAERMTTEIPELDRVLGGGLVPGSLVLLGGDPGIGKSTLVLQGAARIALRGQGVAYVCGEESPRQVRLRAARLGLESAPVTLIPEGSLDAALAAAEAAGVAVVVVDSIQAVSVEGLDTRSGGPAQLAEAGARLVSFAKGTGIATIVTGHVTKGGDIAGPRLLEHLVDAVLYFEGADNGALRVLRAVKNRFGATDEVGVFEMTGTGLRSVENPSIAFLETHDDGASGCAVTAVMEGSRPLAVEVQALAVPSFLANPRRIASGLEVSRLHLLLPGFVIAGLVALAASWLAEHYGAPVMLFALLLGMAVNFLSQDERCRPGIDFASRSVLRLGVALLGARITHAQVQSLGGAALVLTAGAVVLTMACGVLLARATRQSTAYGLLTGGSVAICGASAALAIASVLPRHADHERDTVMTVVAVTALSTVAMVLYPLVAAAAGFDARASGVFLGATIHDVAQVVGAGYSVSAEAGGIGRQWEA